MVLAARRCALPTSSEDERRGGRVDIFARREGAQQGRLVGQVRQHSELDL